MKYLVVLGIATMLFTGSAWEQDSKKPPKTATTPETLTKEIESLKAAKPAWREINWKSCLIEGLKESREKNKPVVLWIFIDRPADDARC